MDRAISTSQQRKNRFSIFLKWLLLTGILIGGYFAIQYFLRQEANQKDFRTARVERGLMENTITAMGTIVPAFEQQLNAPISTEIENVYLKTGAVVRKGNKIMDLAQEFITLEYESLKDQLEVRKNNIDRLNLEFEKQLKDLDYDDQIKALQIEGLEAKYTDIQHLKKIGGATQEEVEQFKLNLQISRLEKKKLENELEYRKKAVKGDGRNLELEVMIQEKKMQELQQKLQQTGVHAPRSGVITWVNENIGRKVNEGEPLVRLADLNSFRIEASCSDRYANLLRVGMPVKVDVNATTLAGKISSILPSVENNTVEFLIELNNAKHKNLRPNMRVEISIIEARKEMALRIKNGAAFNGAKVQDVFVMVGEQAIKKTLELGLTNRNYIEIVGGDLKEGDQVIVSDIKPYEHLDQFKIIP